MDFSSYKILFFGSSEFAVPALLSLLQNKWNVIAAVTQPDRPKGRNQELSPTPLKLAAAKNNVPVLEFESLDGTEQFNVFKKLGADIAIIASYGQIVPTQILKSTRKGFLNLHPSLLPKHRGASPIQTALLNGEKNTGVSIIEVDEQLDHGAIVAQKEVAIAVDDDFVSLHERLAKENAELLTGILKRWIIGEVKPMPQDDRKATFTKILTRDDGRIVWKHSGEEIYNQIRAFTPWPGTWTMLNAERLKITKAAPCANHFSLKPAQILFDKNHIYVGSGNSSILEILRLQPEGRNDMDAKAFVVGHVAADGKYFT